MYDPQDFALNNEVAIITGVGAEIGSAIAQTFAAAGAKVVVSDLQFETASEVAEHIIEKGGEAVAIACDVTQTGDLELLVELAVEHFGKLTLLVSNAGAGGPQAFAMPMSDFRCAYDVNVFALFHLVQLAAPVMEKSGRGAILAITSMSAETKNKRMACYGSSQAAASHLVRNIAFDLGPKNIRVNGIAPGATRTNALACVLNDKIEHDMLQHTPIHRLGEPQDIANAALFLCSRAASWVSGQILTVSGGGVQELD